MKPANTACRQQMTTGKLFHKYFNQLYYYMFSNWYYISTEILSSNQTKYDLPINRDNFLQIIIFYDSLLLKEPKNSRRLMAVTWLFGASWWKLIKALLLYGIVHVSLLFFLTGGTGIVNARVSDKGWCVTCWNKYIDTTSCHI